MMDDMRPVDPVKTAAGYVGGKRMLAKAVIARIEAMPHGLYGEAFVGMGGVFFRRRRAPKVEVINDRSRDVATFFRVLQNHYQAFMDMLRWQLASRDEWVRLNGLDPERLTDLQRAARFLYLQRLSFGGKVAGRTFGISPATTSAFNVATLGDDLAAVHERLTSVWIECLDWREFLKRWDRPEALFYLDPPYWGTEHYYGRGLFERSDYEGLAEALRGLRGRFVMTLNDCEGVRETFGDFALEPVPVTYTTGSGPHRAARELIITDGRQ